MSQGLFRPKSLAEGQEAVVGECNGFTAEQRWQAETPVFARAIGRNLPAAESLPNCLVLDYGCGVGRLAKQVLGQSATAQVLGVDASEDMLALARDHVRDQRFAAANANTLDWRKHANTFDVAYCIYVLQHVPAVEIRDVLTRIHSSLKDDGRFIYCSSDYRMAITADGRAFIDDRLMGVDLRRQVSRFFDIVEPLFGPGDFEGNYVLRKMITGCDDGLAHPALVYRKKPVDTRYL